MKRIFGIAIAALLLAGCTLGMQPPDSTSSPPSGGQQPTQSAPVSGGGETAPGGQTLRGLAEVEQVDILVMETFPLQAAAVVRGALPDACTKIAGVEVARQDNLFTITLRTERLAEAVCAQVLTAFEESVPLDILGLPAGTYTVEANGVQTTFTLEVDNVSPAESPATTATATPTPTATPTETPTPTPTAGETCTNRIDFLSETVPDGSSFAAGATFEKTWTLKNAGTCTWTTDYAAVFVEGEQMGAPTSVPLPKEVKPGQKVTIRVTFTAPDTPGTYRSTWRLQDENGTQFGPGRSGEGEFWAEIRVTESTGDLGLGSPDWVDTLNNASNWYLLDTDSTTFKVKDGALVMTAKNPGGMDEWGLSQRDAVSDFYMEVDFRTGNACTGMDRYGVLVRAPKPDRGYVFGFSCNGQYRLYKWDGSTYTGLQEWTPSPVIRTGGGQKNTLGIWAKGSQFKLYANGQLLGTVQDKAFDSGQFGLFIASSETSKFKVYVEEVRFWNLAP